MVLPGLRQTSDGGPASPPYTADSYTWDIATLIITGSITVQGNFTFGDAAADNFILLGRMSTGTAAGSFVDIDGDTSSYGEGLELRYAMTNWAGTTATFTESKGMYLRMESTETNSSGSVYGLHALGVSNNVANTQYLWGAFFEAYIKGAAGCTISGMYGVQGELTWDAATASCTVTEAACFRAKITGGTCADYTNIHGYILIAGDMKGGSRTYGHAFHVYDDTGMSGTCGWTTGIYLEATCATGISIGEADHGIRFTADPVAGDVTNSFINIGDYTTALVVAPTTENMFGVMHNVSLTNVNVAYWYQAYYTKITTSGTTTATSVAGHALRMNIATTVEAAYGIQCHTNITAGANVTQEVISVSAMVDLGTGETTTDRVVALQAMITGSGTAGTVVGDAIVGYFVNGGTVVTTNSIIEVKNQSAATCASAITLDLDGTVTRAFDFQGTVSNGWTTGDAAVTQSNEYVKIPVRVAGVTPVLYLLAGETWS